MASSLFRIDGATLRIDGEAAEREFLSLLAERLGTALGKPLYLDFNEGSISVSSGVRTGWFKKTWTLVRVSQVVIDGSKITFSLEPVSVRLWNALLENLPPKLPSFVRVVTGKNPAVVIDLSLLPDFLRVTVRSIAFVRGAAVITLGPSAVRLPLGQREGGWLRQ